MSHRGMFFALNRPIITTSTTTTTTTGSCTSGQIDKEHLSTASFTYTIVANEKYGMAFTSDGGKLEKVRFKLAKTGSPTGSAYAELWACTGTPGTDGTGTGTVLATSDALDVSTIGGSLGVIEFSFSGANQYQMSASTSYVIVMGFDNGDGSNYLSFQTSLFSDDYASGNFAGYASGWYYNSDEDSYFSVEVCK